MSVLGFNPADLSTMIDSLLDPKVARPIKVFVDPELGHLWRIIDPLSPTVISKAVLMVQNSEGKEGQPESDQVLGIEDGVVRRSITYRLRAPEDATAAPSYYD